MRQTPQRSGGKPTAAAPPREARRFHPGMAEQQAPRFALYTLKALAFIRVKRGERALGLELLEGLSRLDPDGRVGWRVVSELAAGVGN